MATQSSIRVWNRKKAKEEEEKVYGDAALKWAYETRTGQRLVEQVLSRAFMSRFYGYYQSSRLSAQKIDRFIKKFHIPMEEFEDGPFRSFNDFFIRKFKSGMRPFVQDPSRMPAFAEARYFAYDQVRPEQSIPVKGTSLSSAGLLLNEKWTKTFEGGPLLLARLCPTDYHRFHFPDNSKVISHYLVHGKLHSVNPLALKYKQEIFITNERQVSILDTENFGKLAYIEVGALCVGRIVQTGGQRKEFVRGEEKGYFLFGGSTVIVLGEPGRWIPDEDLLKQTSQGRETLVRLGERVATRC
jgi:phosphatidylserine decarboxylase